MQALAADAGLQAEFGDVIAEMAELQRQKGELAAEYGAFRLLGNPGFGSATMVRALRAYQYLTQGQSDQAREALLSVGDWPASLEERLLTARLSEFQRYLGADDPITQAALQGRTPEDAAEALLAGSVLASAEQTQQAVEAGSLSLDDPVLQIAAVVLPRYADFQSAFAGVSAQEEELRQNSEEILAQREDLERKVELQKRSIEKLQSSEDSVIINVAGRQRMLTQQMAFFSTMLYHGKMGIKTNLQETVDLFDHSLYTLENGGVFKGVDYDGNIPPAKGKMRDRLLYIKEIWMPVHDCINILLNTDYSLSSISASKEKTFQYIQYIEDNIGVLLNANHRLTQAYVDESFSWRKKVFEDMEDLFSDALAKKDGYESESRVFFPN